MRRRLEHPGRDAVIAAGVRGTRYGVRGMERARCPRCGGELFRETCVRCGAPADAADARSDLADRLWAWQSWLEVRAASLDVAQDDDRHELADLLALAVTQVMRRNADGVWKSFGGLACLRFERQRLWAEWLADVVPGVTLATPRGRALVAKLLADAIADLPL